MPNWPLIPAVDLRNPPKGGGYGRTDHAPTHCFIYIDISYGELSVVVGGWVVYLDYSVSSGPFLRFTMSIEFLSEMFDHSVCEIRDPSLTICQK